MKNVKSFMGIFLLAVGIFFSVPAQAQDDLYYDPATDGTITAPSNENTYREDSKITQRYQGDDGYSEEDDYAYEYSSRIRRFHRPSNTVDYYDPIFVDMWMYDPFFQPGMTIYAGGYNDYWRWNRWNRFNRFNRWNTWGGFDPYWGAGFNTWGFGWNRPWGWNTWNNVNVWNNYFYDPYWVWNGYNPYYCPNNVWVNNNYYYDNNNVGGNNGGGSGYNPKTYTGVRRNGTTVNPGYARMASGNTTTAARLEGPRVASTEVIQLKNTRPNGRIESTPGEKSPTGGASDRSGIGTTRPTTTPARTGSENRPTTAPEGRRTTTPETTRPERNVTPSRETSPGREVSPDSRPNREVTPNRETRPAREVTPNRETRPARETTPTERPARRDVTPSREPSPTRRESSRSSGSADDDRPSRRSEPSYERPTRSFESQPSRSSERSSDGGGMRSGGDSGGGSGRSSSPSSSGGGRSGRNN
jgi:hypothetical protein